MEPNTIDALARRIRLWLGLAVLLVTTVAAAGTFVVSKMSDGVSVQVRETHDMVIALAAAQSARADRDSVRFDRAMDVLELAVGAIVEPNGSPDKVAAIAELRRRRHIAP